MSTKLFTLEAVAAKHGDSLLLHWGDPRAPRAILIDGGASGVYNRFLKKRLNQLRERRSDPLPLDLVMISHIDDDHINGILSLVDHLDDLDERGREVPYTVDELWFNSFDDVTGNAAGLDRVVASGRPGAEHAHSAATVASVRQGRRLRDWAHRNGVVLNGGDAMIEGGWVWNLGEGLSLHVLGPRGEQIAEFRTAWDKEVTKKGWAVRADAAEVAAFVDKSPWNLASIVAIASLGNKRMLLTGDARGDHIIDALRADGVLTGSSVTFDVLKVPHHGSDRNVSTDFFRAVKARHYVISGNGAHHNPDVATLGMIVEARGRARYKVHCTYRNGIKGLGANIGRFLGTLSAANRRKFVFRDEARELSLKVDLGKRLRD